MEDQLNENITKSISAFNKQVEERLDDTNFVIENVFESQNILQDESMYDPAYSDGSKTPTDEEYHMNDKPPDRKEEDEVQSDAYDKYIGAENTVDFGTEDPKRATVKGRVRDFEGNLVGKSHTNPLLDTSEYIIKYDDGTSDRMFANSIAENIYAQVDEEGRQFIILKEIADHQTNSDAVTKEHGFITMPNGRRFPKKTTKGWDFLVEWKDGSSSWLPLRELKETNPVELAEYAVANQINTEPALAWWINTVLKKRERIIQKLQKKYWRTEYKFCVRVPKTVDEALQLDKITGTNHWEQALKREMTKVSVAYKPEEGVTPDDVRSGKVHDMIGYQKIKCHIIFNVKMKFTRKARFVAGGHMTQPASSINYSSVVS
jgi:hypothetical protein